MTGRRLAAVALLGLVLRLGVLWVTAPTRPAGDERDYLRRAQLHAEGTVQTARRPPLAERSYAAAFRLFGASPHSARAVNVVAGTATLVALFAIARRFGGPRVGLLAAGLGAIYPDFVAYSSLLFAEALYLLCASAGLALLVALPERERWSGSAPLLAAGAGAAFGLAALAREVGTLLPPLAAAWILWRERARPRRAGVAAAALLAAAAATVLPWTLHVSRESGQLAAVGQTTWLNLYLGNVEPSRPRADRESRKRVLRRDYRALACPEIAPGQREPASCRRQREAAARGIVARAIAERLPAWPFEKVASELPRFFAPLSKPARRLWFGAEAGERRPEWRYRFRVAALDAPAARALAAWSAVLSYVALALLGVAGLVLRPPGAPAGLLALFVAAQILPAVAAFATVRFRQPVMGPLLIGAAWILLAGRAAWRDAGRGRRAAAVVAVAALAALIGTGAALE